MTLAAQAVLLSAVSVALKRHSTRTRRTTSIQADCLRCSIICGMVTNS